MTFVTMEAIRVHPSPDSSNPYSATNPAPPSALRLDHDLPIPKPVKSGELLVKIEAAAVVRDALTWPETYLEEYPILGNDFAGTVVAVHETVSKDAFKPGDEVYGMTDASRAGTWSEYAIVSEKEACVKPKSLSWAEAAAVPMSALTAFQALFDQAGLVPPDLDKPRDSQATARSKTENGSILITGASGSVGLYLIQLARLTGLRVVAASRSNERNKDILKTLGAHEAVEYKDLAKDDGPYRVIIDTIGGDMLQKCWELVDENGSIVSIDSSSYDFVKEHRAMGLCIGKEKVKASWFVVSPSHDSLKMLAVAFESNLLKSFVAGVVSLSDARRAYENVSVASSSRGRLILKPRHGERSQ